jgi:hypothetical protein
MHFTHLPCLSKIGFSHLIFHASTKLRKSIGSAGDVTTDRRFKTRISTLLTANLKRRAYNSSLCFLEREKDMVKKKMIKIILIGILFFTILNIAPALAAECPTCNGVGRIVCPECRGSGKISSGGQEGSCSTCLGSGVVEATVSNKGTIGSLSDGKVIVKGTFQNKESVGTYGNVVAEVDGSGTTYTSPSERTYFPPQQDVTVTLTIDGITDNDYRYLSGQIYLRVRAKVSDVDDVACPDCAGTGTSSAVIEDCPNLSLDF